MKFGTLKRLVIFSTLIAYGYVAVALALPESLEKSLVPPVYVVWLLGIINVVLVLIYSTRILVSRFLFVLLLVSAMAWVFPVLIYTWFGIPCLIVYLLNVLLLLFKNEAKSSKKSSPALRRTSKKKVPGNSRESKRR